MTAAVAMHEGAVQDERNGLESAMWVRAERETSVSRWIDLRTVVIQEEEWVDLIDFLIRQRTLRAEIPDIVGDRFILLSNRSFAQSGSSETDSMGDDIPAGVATLKGMAPSSPAFSGRRDRRQWVRHPFLRESVLLSATKSNSRAGLEPAGA